jgi:hypothetical protein
MSTQLKFRRGNTATAAAFVGQEAEFFVNTDTNRVSIHDGSSPGGHVLASNTDLTSVNQYATAAFNKANTGGTFSGSVTITGDTTASGNLSVGKNLTVTGNLSVLGNTVSIGTATLTVADPMILLATGNYDTDALDIGFSGHYNDTVNAHTGLFRDVGIKEWFFYEGYTGEVSGNNNIITTDPTFNTSNVNVRRVTGNVIAQFVTINGRDQASVDSTQNTSITAVNNFAAAGFAHANNAYDAANTFAGLDAGINATQNTRIQSIETINTNQNNSITIIQGVDNTQNTQISDIQGVDIAQNAAITIIQGVDLGQNTTITAVNNFAAAAYAHANNAFNSGNTFASIEAGIDATQNTRIESIETINTNQNTSISIIQGVDNTQNTQIGGIQGVDIAQNTRMSIIEGVDTAQNTRITIIEGVDSGQNTTITAVQGKMESAFAAANSKVASVSGTSGRITSSGGTTPAIDLNVSGVTASTYGSATSIPGFTVDTYGRITQANSTSFSAVTSAVAGTGISVSAATGSVTFTNSGVTSIVAGTGISISGGTGAVTVTNGGVTSAVAGTGVSVSGATGAVTFSIGQAVATGSNVQFNSLGVGTAGSGTTGEIRATNNITAFYSDKRLKDIISTIPNALSKLLTLSGVIFKQNKKAEEFGYNNYEEQVGVIAQEVQAVLPQVVKPAPFDLDENNQSKSGENYITVQYEKLVPLLIEAIKEQQKQIDELKAKIGN